MEIKTLMCESGGRFLNSSYTTGKIYTCIVDDNDDLCIVHNDARNLPLESLVWERDFYYGEPYDGKVRIGDITFSFFPKSLTQKEKDELYDVLFQ